MRSLPYRSGKVSPLVVVALVAVAAVVGIIALVFQAGNGSRDTLTPEQAQAQFTQLREEIDAAIQNNRDLDSYISEVQTIVSQLKKPAPAYVLLGQMFMRQGRDEQAIAAIDKALNAQPDQPEVALLAGTLCFQHEKYDQALGFYGRVLQHDKDNTRARLHLGSTHLKLGEYDQARNVLLEALKINSNLHQAHAMLASVYAAQNRTSLAQDQIIRAIELLKPQQEKQRIAYVIQRSQLLRRANQPDEAISVLSDLPARTVLTPPVMAELAICHAMKGQPRAAARLYEQALALNPLDENALAKAAAWWLKAEEPDKARQHIKELKRTNPVHRDLPQLEANLRALASRLEQSD